MLRDTPMDVLPFLFDAHFCLLFYIPNELKMMKLTFKWRQRFDFTVLLVDVESRTHLTSILFDEGPGEIFSDGGRWRWSIVVNSRWGHWDRDARWCLQWEKESFINEIVSGTAVSKAFVEYDEVSTGGWTSDTTEIDIYFLKYSRWAHSVLNNRRKASIFSNIYSSWTWSTDQAVFTQLSTHWNLSRSLFILIRSSFFLFARFRNKRIIVGELNWNFSWNCRASKSEGLNS